MKAVIVAHGEVDPGDAAQAREADLLIAANGGTERLARWGIAPHVVVGDLDSLSAEARASLDASRVERHPAAKDKTDTELALDRAIAAGADEIVILGALGGPRIDHALANALLLAGTPARVRIVRGAMSARLLRAGESADLAGAVGELVTLLAIGGDAGGVTTRGLRYPLNGGSLRLGSSRGVSNEVASTPASVTLATGMLLVIEGGALPGAEQKPQA